MGPGRSLRSGDGVGQEALDVDRPAGVCRLDRAKQQRARLEVVVEFVGGSGPPSSQAQKSSMRT